MTHSSNDSQNPNNTLIVGGTGKTGSRIVERLTAAGVPVRIGSRTGTPNFDWLDSTTWGPVLEGMANIYISFYPDLALPGTTDIIRAFTAQAVRSGAQRFVLISGRGESEAQACEKIVQQAGVKWTILRVSWFCQNFSEGFMKDMVLNGAVTLPPGAVKEPFIDIDDIADAAVVALTEQGHSGKIYEMTGPQLLTMTEAVAVISDITGKEIQYIQISPDDLMTGLKQQGLPAPLVSLYHYLFTTVLDGRNAQLTDGVKQILGRDPRSFETYTQAAAAAGAWG
ncbi:MAG: NmrA family NAD(P)-binding protein [Pseudomonadales bacterium]|nr:NmrA family NAD(P)-binding protein [Pseudomonadales bacterium]